MNDKMEAELLPCPFCGGQADVYIIPDNMRGVQCEGCAARASEALNRTDAIAAWNRRTRDAIPLLLARVLEVLEPFVRVANNITSKTSDDEICSVGINQFLTAAQMLKFEQAGRRLASNKTILIVSLDGINAGDFRAARTLRNEIEKTIIK